MVRALFFAANLLAVFSQERLYYTKEYGVGMFDYLIGKSVGRDEGRNSVDNRARADADVARINASQSQDAALAIALALRNTREELAVMRKRFYREREKRFSWQRTAEARRLSLNERGVSVETIYAEQNRILNDPSRKDAIVQFLKRESAKIDAEFETPSSS